MRSIGQRSLGDQSYIRRPQAYMNQLESKEPTWAKDAKCAGKGDLFFYESADTVSKLYKARNICGTCPVKAECLDDATEEDREWSVRGGKLPRKMTELTAQRIAGAVESAEKPHLRPTKCSKGHERVWRRKGGTTWQACCKPCTSAWEWSRATGRPAEEWVPRKEKPPAETCVKGHDDWIIQKRVVNGVAKERRRCKECSRQFNRAWHAKRRVESEA